MRTAIRLSALAGVILIVPHVATAQDGTDAARRDLSTFEACARIANDSQRHQCLDEALRSTGMIDQQAEEARTRANYGRPEAAQTKQVKQDTTEQPAKSARSPTREPLQTAIASAKLIGKYSIRIVTTDAGSWESTEMQRFRRTPAQGDNLEIIPAALGGHRCRLERSTIFPCRRID